MTKLFVLISVLFGTSAFASDQLSCLSATNQFGGNSGIQLVQDGNTVSISGSSQGGMAHFMMHWGPFVATPQAEGDVVTFTFVNGGGATERVTLVSTNIEGQIVQTATLDSGNGTAATSMSCK